MGACETAQHLRQHGFSEILLNPEADPACEFRPANGADRLVIQAQYAAGIGQQHFAALGQRQPPAGFAHQSGFGLVLQLLELCADRRGRTPQSVCGLRERPALDANHETAERVQIQMGKAQIKCP
ncbi:hypothetical protein D3C71_1556530 [compost metagenome]